MSSILIGWIIDDTSSLCPFNVAVNGLCVFVMSHNLMLRSSEQDAKDVCNGNMFVSLYIAPLCAVGIDNCKE